MGSSPAEFWEQRYAESDQVWSGRVNQTLVDLVHDLRPGRALDVGCGEGGDSIWLAQQGWQVTGVDLSGTAVRRAAEAAERLGLRPGQTRFVAADLDGWEPEDQFDLVTAFFLQSWPVTIHREELLHRMTGFLAPGGVLLVVSHAEPPPWSRHRHEGQTFPTASEDLAALRLEPGHWEVLICETRGRHGRGPDDTTATLLDNVVMVRRRPEGAAA